MLIIISNCKLSEKLGSYETTHPKCVCVSECVSVRLSVRPSVRPSVFYHLDHWRDQNEMFRCRKHHPLNHYYILKTYCLYVNVSFIYEKLSSCLILVADIHTYFSQ